MVGDDVLGQGGVWELNQANQLITIFLNLYVISHPTYLPSVHLLMRCINVRKELAPSWAQMATLHSSLTSKPPGPLPKPNRPR